MFQAWQTFKECDEHVSRVAKLERTRWTWCFKYGKTWKSAVNMIQVWKTFNERDEHVSRVAKLERARWTWCFKCGKPWQSGTVPRVSVDLSRVLNLQNRLHCNRGWLGLKHQLTKLHCNQEVTAEPTRSLVINKENLSGTNKRRFGGIYVFPLKYGSQSWYRETNWKLNNSLSETTTTTTRKGRNTKERTAERTRRK